VFVRVKTISGKSYAYLVENTWKRGKVRQKVKKYLGPVVKLEQQNDTSFAEWKNEELPTYVAQTSVKRIMQDLLAWTLSRHEHNDTLHISDGSVKRRGRDIVLHLHDGYWHKQAMNKLLYFKPTPEDRPGELLAEAFANAGIPVEKELFILLYRKLHRM